jgi:hypothetical protein
MFNRTLFLMILIINGVRDSSANKNDIQPVTFPNFELSISEEDTSHRNDVIKVVKLIDAGLEVNGNHNDALTDDISNRNVSEQISNTDQEILKTISNMKTIMIGGFVVMLGVLTIFGVMTAIILFRKKKTNLTTEQRKGIDYDILGEILVY